MPQLKKQDSETPAVHQLKAQLERLQREMESESVAETRLKHGFYSKHKLEAIRALGEDQGDFDALLASLTATWCPATGYEHLLVRRLARAYWRLERADGIQDGITTCRAEFVNRALKRQAETEEANRKQLISVLREVLGAADASDSFVTRALVEGLHEMFGRRPSLRRRKILYSTFRLLPQDAADRPALPAPSGPALLAAEERLEPAQGEERVRVREELCSMVREEIESLEAAREEQLAKGDPELSSALRDACLAANDNRSDFLLRSENSYLRQVERLTQLLVKVQELRARQMQQEMLAGQNEGISGYPAENRRRAPFSPRLPTRLR
jgi:hypothetical protein